jgi:two-component system NarL family response regulator
MTIPAACPPIRVLVVDDHVMVRQGLVAVIEQPGDIHVVGQASNGLDAVALYGELAPDVTIMDLRMPGLDGVQAIERIRRGQPQARIILLTTFDGEDDIYRALRAGAKAYLLKDGTVDDLLTCIREVHAGKTFIPPKVAIKLADRVGGSELTDRELQVLDRMAAGRSNREIAQALAITEGTVKGHVNRILEKLNAGGRTEAVTLALRRGLIRLG